MQTVSKCLQGGIWGKQSDIDSDLDGLTDAEGLTWHI